MRTSRIIGRGFLALMAVGLLVIVHGCGEDNEKDVKNVGTGVVGTGGGPATAYKQSAPTASGTKNPYSQAAAQASSGYGGGYGVRNGSTDMAQAVGELASEEVPGRLPEQAMPSTEAYDRVVESPFLRTVDQPKSTFSIDVDTASYANVRRFLTQNMMPPPDAVRIEEMLNYFTYDDPAPSGDEPFRINLEVARCPWKPDHRLVRIGLKGKDLKPGERPATNLVFLLDVSGSMNQPQKLPLLKAALKMLVERLGENDRVGIVVYAGASGVALPSTSCDRKAEILQALDSLQAGGSTNGGEGIRLAYQLAVANFIKGGVNRVILATDGDFNVGVTDREELTRLIASNAKTGVFLSVLGFGMGNYKDGTLQTLADKGNGNHAYIDTLNEARKVLVEQLGGTLVTIAKDVKIQVEFNPVKVASYRLIGYENRLLRARDFHDDTKDAGEVGAGHTVTALYELVPPGKEDPSASPEPLKYQTPPRPSEEAVKGDDLLTVRLRYKEPDAERSQLLEGSVADPGGDDARPSDDFQFSAAVAEFGMLLRNSPDKGRLTYAGVLEVAESSLGADRSGYRREFLDLVRRAQALSGQ